MDRPRPRAWEFGQSDDPVRIHLRCFDPRSSSPPLPGGALDHVGCHASRSTRWSIRRKRLTVKVAFGELEGEVPGMPDETSARLEQPLDSSSAREPRLWFERGYALRWLRGGTAGHSITWSARMSTDCGIVSPRALAVLRLMTSSNF